MNLVKGFPPIAASNAKLLILGTAPSGTSLKQQQYYAHQRNAFWPILAQLLGFSLQLSYSQRQTQLLQRRIALWDVFQNCQRQTSADAQIRQGEWNAFGPFFQAHSQLKAVFFNGKMAEKCFLQQPERPNHLVYSVLPSTSPANAQRSFSEKLQIWKAIKTFCA